MYGCIVLKDENISKARKILSKNNIEMEYMDEYELVFRQENEYLVKNLMDESEVFSKINERDKDKLINEIFDSIDCTCWSDFIDTDEIESCIREEFENIKENLEDKYLDSENL